MNTFPTYLSPEELWQKEANNFLNRAADTIRFLPDSPEQFPVCDLGENNPLKEEIENYWNCKIKSIAIDLDHKSIAKKWGVILCFEILEHLFNPLFALENMRKALLKNGRIFLSTPYQRPQILKAVHHFHEIPDDRLLWLFERAGLKIIRYGKATIAGNLIDHIHGIRPILRYFQNTRLFELRNYENFNHHTDL